MYNSTNETNYNTYVEINSGVSSGLSSEINFLLFKDHIRSFKTTNYTLQDGVTMEPTERTIIINNTLQPSFYPTLDANYSMTTNISITALVISMSIIVPILSLLFCYKLYKMMHKKNKTNEDIEFGIDGIDGIDNIV
jgi:ABC-type thiamin/hydroxymethylpyrimidine transport system permease subunit